MIHRRYNPDRNKVISPESLIGRTIVGIEAAYNWSLPRKGSKKPPDGYIFLFSDGSSAYLEGTADEDRVVELEWVALVESKNGEAAMESGGVLQS